MNERDEHILQTATDRFERRLGEEMAGVRREISGVRSEVAEVRTEIAEVRTEIAEVRTEIAGVRTEIIDRSHELLKWTLLFWMSSLAAIAALLSLYK